MLTRNNTGPMPEYFQRYVNLLPETDIFILLQEQPGKLKNLVAGLSEEAAAQGYAPGKWSVKEVIGHMVDTERIFFYRALCISRGETQSLPGFDENTYVQNARFNQHHLAELMADYEQQRKITLNFFQRLAPDMLERVGRANGQPVSVKAIGVITTGHELHHLHILQERYRL